MQTPNTKARLAAALGVAALAIPGGVVVGNAFAADGTNDSSSTTAPIQQSEKPYAPAQDQRPDGRDCPEKQGGGDSESAAPSTGAGAQQTAL